MNRNRNVAYLVCSALMLASIEGAAQSRQAVSLQASGEWVFPTKSYGDVLQNGSALGWELQARYTFGHFSIGAGYQRSVVFHSDEANLTGTLAVGFIEPRIVLAVIGEHLAPYAALRLGYGSLMIRDTPRITQNSFTYGAGAGVLIAVVPRLAIDVGGQYFIANFGGQSGTAGYVLARLGVAVGLF